MSEAVRLLAFGVAFLLLFAAVGSGPVVAFGRGMPARAALTPVVGFAAAASLLITASTVMPMRVAAWALLVPAAAGSVAWAWAARTRGGGVDWREAAVPLGLCAGALLLWLLPALLRGTVGPVSLLNDDALAYIPQHLWLRDHTLYDALPAEAIRWDRSLTVGHALTAIRSGDSALAGAMSALLRTDPADLHFALCCAVASLVPPSIWAAARELGAGRTAAAAGAALGLAPTFGVLVADSALANVSGLALVAPTLVLLLRWVGDGRRGALALCALLLGGLVAVYPEMSVPLGLTAALVVGFAPARRRTVAARVGVLLALTALAGLGAVVHAAQYLSLLAGSNATILVPRHLTVGDLGSWAYGLVHVYELARFDRFAAWKVAIFAGAVPAGLLGVSLLGAARTSARAVAVVAAPVAVAVLTGLYVRQRYTACEYCQWKAFSFMLPFLAVGVAVGVHGTWRLLARPGAPAAAGRAGLAGLLALTAVGVGRATGELTWAQYRSPSATATDVRDLAAAGRGLPHGASILLAGVDATAAPRWTMPDVYYHLRGGGRRLSLDGGVEAGFSLALGPPSKQFADAFRWAQVPFTYDPAYRYVVTPFQGLASGRRLVAAHGRWGLYRRAPIDVAVMRTGWAHDAAEGARAIPWLQGPFELWVSSPRARRAALWISLRRPLHDGATLAFSSAGATLPVRRVVDDGRMCVDVSLRAGRTVVRADTRFDVALHPLFPLLSTRGAASPLGTPMRPQESDPVPPPPKALGLTRAEARPGRCPAGRLEFLDGWKAPRAPGAERWIAGGAALRLGPLAGVRPPLEITALVRSRAVPRSLVVQREGGPVLARVAVPAGTRPVPLRLRLPGGLGSAILTLVPQPGPGPPSAGDPRRLAVAIDRLQVRPARRSRQARAVHSAA
ncbi:MAG: hypothetical protein QOE65_12 [Solirubrobacteraceae bacterium]|nr:hypothetical protein [Solirubrobacteraceae bacterium]